MKKILFLLLLPSLLLVASCGKDDPVKATRSVLIYVAGNNTLSAQSYDLVDQLGKGYLPDMLDREKNLLVYFHSRDKRPILCKLNRRADGGLDSTVICVYPESTDSATPEQFARVLRDAEHFYPADNHGLIFWSHGSGFIPVNYEREPYSLRSVGRDEDTKSEIDIMDFAASLLPVKYDYILFDCCLMGGIEVAYELKDATRYLVFSPTEILSQGFPYYSMMEPLLTGTSIEESLITVAKDYYNYYKECYEETKIYYNPDGGTVSVIKTDELPAVAEQCKTLFAKYRDEIKAIDVTVIQPYFRGGMYWFYDLSDFIGHFATDAEHNAFDEVLGKAILYKAATPEFLTIKIKKFCGVSSYIPDEGFVKLNAYYKNLKWNRATELI